MAVLLAKCGADVYATSDYIGLLSMAIATTNRDILKMAIDLMIPSRPAHAPMLTEFLQHRHDPKWQFKDSIQALQQA